jgi:hypothetical protein
LRAHIKTVYGSAIKFGKTNEFTRAEKQLILFIYLSDDEDDIVRKACCFFFSLQFGQIENGNDRKFGLSAAEVWVGRIVRCRSPKPGMISKLGE